MASMSDGPVAGPGAVDGRPRHLVHGVDVVAVDDDRLEAVGRRAVRGRVLHRGHVADRGVLHVLVVLADEDDRRLPDRGHVERLVEGADVRRAVAEEADRDLAGLAVLRGPRRPQRDRQVGADDRVRAHRAVLDAGQVHRAALAAEQARSRGRTARRRSAPSARRGPACGCGRDTCRTCSRRRASPRRTPAATASWPTPRWVVPRTRPSKKSSWARTSKKRHSTIVRYIRSRVSRSISAGRWRSPSVGS